MLLELTYKPMPPLPKHIRIQTNRRLKNLHPDEYIMIYKDLFWGAPGYNIIRTLIHDP